MRQAFQTPQMQAAIAKLAAKLPALAEAIAGAVAWATDNPGKAIVGAITASIAKAAVGDAVASLFKSFPAASVGVGLLAAAAAAAAAAIADYEAKATKQEETLTDTPQLIKKAQEEIKTQGSVSKETLDELAARRAEFEGVQKASETGGVGLQRYTTILAAKLTGGADEVARAEATTKVAEKLGAEGVQKTITDLDSLIAQGVQARQAAPPAGGGAPPVVPGAPVAAPGAAPGRAAPGVDPATQAAITGQAVGTAFKGALAGQVVQVRVVGGTAPGGGPVPAGTAPR